MRIALFPSAYAPAVGGVEELTARLAHRLLGSGDDIEVWTIRHPADLPEDEDVDGVRVRRFLLPMPRLAARALVGFPREAGRAWATLVEAATEFRPDVLHVQCFSANGAYAVRLARHLRVPLILTLQGETVMDDTDIYDHSLALRLSLRWGLSHATAVTGCSRFVLADAERRFGLAPGRSSVIPNGVELVEEAAAEPLRLPFERFVFAMGRVVPKKGFDLLLDAFALLAPRQPGIGLVIGGDGPGRSELELRAVGLGIRDRIVFPGRLSRARVAWAMAKADVFVLPSRVEPFGIVILEALRACTPVVVSSHGGAPEVVHDERDGLVADPFDAQGLAAAVERLLDSGELRKRLTDAGRRRAEEFDWGRIVDSYRALYET